MIVNELYNWFRIWHGTTKLVSYCWKQEGPIVFYHGTVSGNLRWHSQQLWKPCSKQHYQMCANHSYKNEDPPGFIYYACCLTVKHSYLVSGNERVLHFKSNNNLLQQRINYYSSIKLGTHWGLVTQYVYLTQVSYNLIQILVYCGRVFIK